MKPKEMKNNNHNKSESIHAHYKNLADDEIMLQILDIIESNPNTSQKKIMQQTGLATGLVHSFMHQILSKGWVRAKKVNAKRWLYFTTPAGFMEKSKLTINYLGRTLKTYRTAHNIIQNILNICIEKKWEKLVIAGDNELSEIAALNIKASDELVFNGLVARNRHGESIAGQTILPLVKIAEMDYQKILVCDSTLHDWFRDKANQIPHDEYIFLLDLAGKSKIV